MTPFPRRVRTGQGREFMTRGACASAPPPAPHVRTEGDPVAELEAKRICRQCPVLFECLNYALDHHEWRDIWGGKNPDERAQVAQRRNRSA